MYTIDITVPAKTFLLGEYVVLQGGPGIVLTTAPRFKLIARMTKNKHLANQCFHPLSPAGKLLEQYATIFKSFHLEFHDPYQGLGGLGASSAQFLSLYALLKFVQQEQVEPFSLLSSYLNFSWDGKGIAPSGVDLISQLQGNLCYFDKNNEQIDTLSGWPFQDINFYLIHTGNKVATHTHLQSLTLDSFEHLNNLVTQGWLALRHKNSQDFINAISLFGNQLQELNLVASHTLKLMDSLQTDKVLAMKGCGALGADILLLLAENQAHTYIAKWAQTQQLTIIHWGKHSSSGLKIKEIFEGNYEPDN